MVIPVIPPLGEGAPRDPANMISRAQQQAQQHPAMSPHFLSSAPAQSKTGVRLNEDDMTAVIGGNDDDDTEDDDTEDDDTEDDIILYVY